MNPADATNAKGNCEHVSYLISIVQKFAYRLTSFKTQLHVLHLSIAIAHSKLITLTTKLYPGVIPNIEHTYIAHQESSTFTFATILDLSRISLPIKHQIHKTHHKRRTSYSLI